MRIIPRPRALLSLLLAAGLLLTACSSGPSQAGSAAIVGDRAIPVTRVQHELQWLLDHVRKARQMQDSGKLAQVSRRLVRGRVIHQLVGVAAEQAGLRPDHGKVSDLIDSSGGKNAAAKSVGVSPERVQQVAADQVLLQELGRHYLPKLSVSFVGTMITAEQPQATAEDQALELAHRVAAHPKQAQQVLGTEGRAVHRDDLSLRKALRQAPELATSAVFGAEPGTVLAVQPRQGRSGWLVAKVTERNVSDDDKTAQPQKQNPRLLYQVGLRMLQPVASRLEVKINPRYGVWDASAMSIASKEEELSGHLLGSSTVRP